MQRIGWVFMGLLSLAGLLGLLGPELLSWAQVGKPEDGLWLKYERFERFQSSAQLRVHFKPESGTAGQVRIWIDRDFY